MPDAKEFLTAEEVSEYLRIPQSTIYKLAQDKILPSFKVGKHWRFRRETIVEWIKKQENNREHESQKEKTPTRKNKEDSL